MSGSNCCFLSCIQVSQEAGDVIWYSRLFKNIPQFVVIHTVKGFRTVNEAEVDFFFFNSLVFSKIQQDQILVPCFGSMESLPEKSLYLNFKQTLSYFLNSG